MEVKKAELKVCDGWCEDLELTEEKSSIIPIKIPKEVKKQIKCATRKQHREIKRRKAK